VLYNLVTSVEQPPQAGGTVIWALYAGPVIEAIGWSCDTTKQQRL
jgi:hypothetical protein